MNYKKYISNYTYKGIFICICILLLFIISNYLFRKNKRGIGSAHIDGIKFAFKNKFTFSEHK